MKGHNIRQKQIALAADLHTPVGLYLQLRDQYRGSALLECADFHQQENSRSIICCDSIARIQVKGDQMTSRWPNGDQRTETIKHQELINRLQKFVRDLGIQNAEQGVNGLYGHFNFEAAKCFDKLELDGDANSPLANFSLYRFIIEINHFHDSMTITENIPNGEASEMDRFLSLIEGRQSNAYGFRVIGSETANMKDESFIRMVQQGIAHCKRGDVFQIVLSRSFSQQFSGDEFQVYRSLRSLNPSPYLFYFDFGNYKLMGSSPEAQLTVKDGLATINPIAGTYKRTGKDEEDRARATELATDPKENAEHTMLVDLARNDLNRCAKQVRVASYKEIQFYSHVIHLVSKVEGKLEDPRQGLEMFAKSFPAGTLSGAPKFRAMELISELEPNPRGFYGGSIGHIGLNGDINQAILIRSMISNNNELRYQAGAGVVSASIPASELAEVDNKLGAVRKAIQAASKQTKAKESIRL